MLYMVRHGVALAREQWPGADGARPLVARGWAQAVALMTFLEGRSPQHFLSSPAVRCRDTLVPAAHRDGLEVVEEDLLADCDGQDLVESVLRSRLRRALRVIAQRAPGTAVACSHGDTIPLLLAEAGVAGHPACPKGSVWELHLGDEGEVTHAAYRGRPGEL